MKRIVVLASAVVALAAAPGAFARSSVSDEPGLCPPAGSLVTYSTTGVWAGRTIVVQQDGRAWLCWRRASRGDGRLGFMLTPAQMTTLRADLGQIGVHRLAPPPAPPCVACNAGVSTLSYRGATLPWSGRQTSKAAADALTRAQRLLVRLAAQQLDPSK
jgi:hypothetical protein